MLLRRMLLVLIVAAAAYPLPGCAPKEVPMPVPTQPAGPAPFPNQCLEMLRRGEKC
jgi:hypothetical protein